MGLKYQAALVIIMLSVSSAGDAQAQGRWQEHRPMEAARSYLGAAVVNDEIYVAGGAGLTGPQDVFELYDPIADFWIPLPSLPGGRERFGMAAAGGQIYVSGGFVSDGDGKPNREFWSYEPEMSQWHKMRDMPGGRSGHVMAAVGDKLYVIGGQGNAKAVWIFDLATGKWAVSGASMPAPRAGAAGLVMDGSIYIIGGVAPGGQISSRVDVFDAAKGAWARAANLPGPRLGLAAGVSNGEIHVAGGATTNPRRTYVDHFQYDLGTNVWRKAEPLTTPRFAAVGATTKGRWYVIGGGASPGFFTVFTAADTVESFGP